MNDTVHEPPPAGGSPDRPLMGVDPGLARTGLSICDTGLKVATPVAVLRGGLRRVESDIRRTARERGAGGLVVGLPTHMDGREGELAPRVRRMAARLARSLGVPVWLWDESLSTWEVERLAREAGTRGRGRDDLAAVVILQGFLDAEGWKKAPAVQAPPRAEAS